AQELELFYINSGIETHYIYPNGDEVCNVKIIYLCKKWQGEPQNSDGEMEELRFFDLKEIDLDQISPPIRPVVHKLMDEINSL
ncbi:MAG: hypothetical protein IIY76_09385, partial [Erysipelotrichaceae bacterium]|nr:hypothetical protein [Erysipelotrichaceae bacterium]